MPVLMDGVVVEELPLDPMQGYVLSLVNGLMTVESLADATGVSVVRMNEVLGGLETLGAIRWEERMPESAGFSQQATREKRRPVENLPDGVQDEVDAMLAMPKTATHYQILGVASDAPKAVIRKAYYSRSKRLHPDSVFGKDVGEYKARMEHAFRRITNAYEVLSRAKSRREYDHYLSTKNASRATISQLETGRVEAEEIIREVTGHNIRLPDVDKSAASIASSVSASRPPPPMNTPPVNIPPNNPSAAKTRKAPRDVSAEPNEPTASPETKPGSGRGSVGTTSRPTSTKTAPAKFRPSVTPTSAKTVPAKFRPSAQTGDAKTTSANAKSRAVSPLSQRAPQHSSDDDAQVKQVRRVPAKDRKASARALWARKLRHKSSTQNARAVGKKSSTTGGTPSVRVNRHPSIAPGKQTSAAPPRSMAGGSRPSPPMDDEAAKARQQRLRDLASSLKQVAEHTGGVDRVERHLEDARAAEAGGDVVGAANALRLAVAIAPERSDIRADYDRIRIAVAQSLAESYQQQARYEEEQGAWREASLSWAKVADGSPENPLPHRKCAEAIIHARGDLRVARNYARRAVDIDPDDVDSRVVLARIFLAANMVANARRELEDAANLDPSHKVVENLLKELG